jgi:uncharacterized tellurite resistance protein B-like protein
MSELSQAQRELSELIDRIFADGKIEPEEREQLRSFWANRGLTVGQVRAVVDSFVARVWGEVNADGQITDEERTRLRAVVSGLRLPDEVLPPAVRWAVTSP